VTSFDESSWADDETLRGFVHRFNRQVDDNHASVKEGNARKRDVYRKSPALQIALGGMLEPEGEVECAQAIELLKRAQAKDPLLNRYLNYLNVGHSQWNTEWWHAFGHQQVVMFNFLYSATRGELEANLDGMRENKHPILWDPRIFPRAGEWPLKIGPREAAMEWYGRVERSQVHLWHDDVREAALAAPLPPHVVEPNALPFGDIFFSFEKAAWIEMGTPVQDLESSEPVEAHAETWWVHISSFFDAGMIITFDKQIWPHATYQPQTHLIMEPVSWGQRWPEDFSHRRFKDEIGAVLRMLAFMQAPFVDAAPALHRLPRPIRREYDRMGKPAPEKEVSIVVLRRSLHEPVYPALQEGEDGPVREYKHSWWVAGHYRWQYYPAEKTHRLIAISPFMKQKGKPLLRKLYDVKQ
jgi:hypothetical protein